MFFIIIVGIITTIYGLRFIVLLELSNKVYQYVIYYISLLNYNNIIYIILLIG